MIVKRLVFRITVDYNKTRILVHATGAFKELITVQKRHISACLNHIRMCVCLAGKPACVLCGVKVTKICLFLHYVIILLQMFCPSLVVDLPYS